MATHLSQTEVKPARQPWYKESVVYQIYPASFYCAPDSPSPPNSKSATVGNVKGIISKIPYIASLGFDALWLSPIFASPQTDMGYDISDYRSIYPPYGTVDDVQKLIDTLHETQIPDSNSPTGSRPMRLLMDLVVNHTSSEHPWFVESAKSKTNQKSDWYFWRDAKINADGSRAEPNNWRSIFGGPAWHYVESRQQYYLALFLPTQPDLNWENADMRAEIYADMKFWLDRGVDGWRIDSMNLMSKVPGLPDARVTQLDEKYQDGKEYYASGPKIHHYLQEMRLQVIDAYGEDKLFTVGELGSAETDEGVARYVAKSRHELDCVFAGMDLDFGPNGKYDSSQPFVTDKLRQVTNRWQEAMPKVDGWNSIYLDNHDSGRSLSRYASDLPEYRAHAATMLATYLCTLSGTVFVLAGQEIGMANLGEEVGIEGYIDVEGQNWYQKILAERGGPGSNPDMTDVMAQLRLKARDHGRLPMQWTDQAPNAGFCADDQKPWMTVNPDYQSSPWNVTSQIDDPTSILAFWRTVVQLRRQYAEILVHGTYESLFIEETGAEVIGYIRSSTQISSSSSGSDETATNKGKLAVLLNFAKQPSHVTTDRFRGWKTRLLTNYVSKTSPNSFSVSEPVTIDQEIILGPYEAVILSEI